MDPIQMMMFQLMQGGMGGGSAQPANPQTPPAMANPQMVPMADQLRRSAAAGGEAPASYRGGIIPMMAGGQMGTVGQDLARQAGPAQMGPGGVVSVTDVPQGKLGWMDQMSKFFGDIDPNLRLMMGLQGAGNLGRILGGGA